MTNREAEYLVTHLTRVAQRRGLDQGTEEEILHVVGEAGNPEHKTIEDRLQDIEDQDFAYASEMVIVLKRLDALEQAAAEDRNRELWRTLGPDAEGEE